MMTMVHHWWERVRASYWFVPSQMVVLAIAMAGGMIVLDETLAPRAGRWWALIYVGGPDGARTLLSTIAGSMMTVAGVTFSITIVALTLTSSQFGPRLLRNFMRDLGNQVVLGTFLATFAYCLFVLRAVHGDESQGFVPYLALNVAIALALVGLGVLIYFIHHVSTSIQADRVMASVSGELNAAIDRLYPEPLEHESDEREPPAAVLRPDATTDERPILAARSGYVQAIDLDGLMRLAVNRNVVLSLKYRPGQFVTAGTVLAMGSPPDRVMDELAQEVNACHLLGVQRTLEQDVEFAIHQLVEIAVRALSPGVNDPFTAMTCLDWLGASICRILERRFPVSVLHDEEGTLRLVVSRTTVAGVLDAAFNQIRQCARENTAVTIRLVETLAVIAAMTRSESDRLAVLHHTRMIERGSLDGLREERDQADVRERVEAVMRALNADT